MKTKSTHPKLEALNESIANQRAAWKAVHDADKAKSKALSDLDDQVEAMKAQLAEAEANTSGDFVETARKASEARAGLELAEAHRDRLKNAFRDAGDACDCMTVHKTIPALSEARDVVTEHVINERIRSLVRDFRGWVKASEFDVKDGFFKKTIFELAHFDPIVTEIRALPTYDLSIRVDFSEDEFEAQAAFFDSHADILQKAYAYREQVNEERQIRVARGFAQPWPVWDAINLKAA